MVSVAGKLVLQSRYGPAIFTAVAQHIAGWNSSLIVTRLWALARRHGAAVVDAGGLDLPARLLRLRLQRKKRADALTSSPK
jgi:hypothetical protein